MSKKPSKKQQNIPSWLKWAVIGGLGLLVIAVASVLVMNQPGGTVKCPPCRDQC